jgi:branched-chain amino acid transport system substrate-binding protein
MTMPTMWPTTRGPRPGQGKGLSNRGNAGLLFSGLLLAALAGVSGLARAEDLPGVTATEIKIGNTNAYSGPASAYGVIAKTEAAFFQMVNDQGGVAGHKVNLIY